MPTGNPRHPGLHRILAAALACALGFTLAGCHHAPPPPSNVTPEKAVATNLRLTAMGDFDGLMKNRLPPADYAQWRAEWDKAHARAQPATAAQQQQFAQIMQMLTAPDAEARLARRLQPELAKLHGGNDASIPIASGILEAAGKEMIAASPQLGPSQKTLATQGLGVLIAWTQTTDFSDPKKARKAIALICATARQLHVQTLAQWRALDYAGTTHAYALIWNGLEELLDLYGLDLANSLTTADIGSTANDGTHATVKLDMNLAGHALTGQWPMVKVAGHWYDASLLQAWQQAHPAVAASAATPAPGTTAASATSVAPAASTSAPASAKPSATVPPASAGHVPASSSPASG